MRRSIPSLQIAALGTAVVTALALIGWLLLRSHAGFDFTDESFYLIWISNPEAYPVSTTQFGFLYHPLYRLLGGDITLLRQCNVLFTFLLAWGVSLALFRAAQRETGDKGSWQRSEWVAVAFVTAAGALAFFSVWLLTPNYNSLALQALLVTAVGMLLAEAEDSWPSLAGWILIGAGGWLAMLAKPTTAVALAIVVCLYLFAAGKWRWHLLALAGAVCGVLLFASAETIDGSVGGFIARLCGGFANAKLLMGNQVLRTMVRLDALPLDRAGWKMLLSLTALIFGTAFLCLSITPIRRTAGSALALVACLFCLGLIGGFYLPASGQPLHSIVMLALLLGILPAVFLVLWRLPPPRRIPRQGFAAAIAFALFPHVYAFGSGRNYWDQGAHAGFFWMLAGMALVGYIRPLRWLPILSVAVAALTLTTLLLYAAMEYPYRQAQPLRLATDQLLVTPTGATLPVSKEIADYARGVETMVTAHGFTVGDPMIDMTGQAPGALYLIGAKAIGQPWMIGGYPGSEALARAQLARASCDDIARAWVLTEPAGARKLPMPLLQHYGIYAARDLSFAGTLIAPSDSDTKVRRQFFYKPARPFPAARAACEQARKAQP